MLGFEPLWVLPSHRRALKALALLRSHPNGAVDGGIEPTTTLMWLNFVALFARLGGSDYAAMDFVR